MTMSSASRRGPDLPYSVVAGVMPCATGWLVASAKLQGTIFSTEFPQVIESFIDVIDQRPSYSVIALNAPIGYLDERVIGGRTCDRQARALLRHRGGAVHSAPQRSTFEQDAEGHDDHLDAVSKKLLPRYREVALEMAPYRQRSVYEVQSELSFYQLNGDVPLRWRKRSEKGMLERKELLEKRVPGVEKILTSQFNRVPYSHMLDVAALLWTARRVFARAALRIPADAEFDEEGLRMEIVY
jgi:predicted RNase H-like nuclease